jgi:hypothetical protein
MDRSNPKLAHLFDPAPSHWALPGDAALWRAMREQFAQVPLPRSASEVQALVDQAFRQVCSRPMSADQSFRVPSLATGGGRSAGAVSPQHWRDRLVPLLTSRWQKAEQDRLAAD